MAREKINTGGAAVLDDDATSGEQGNMFPDLDKSKPEEKKLLTLAKKWIELYDARKAALEEAKEKEDGAHEAMIEHAKFLKINHFTAFGREITIEHKDKAKVKASKVSDVDDDAGDD